MIYTITFNPSLDYVVSVPEFEAGKVNRTKNETIWPGGKGINVSMVLGNMGYENIALGFFAGFTGEKLMELLDVSGVNCDFIRVNDAMTRVNLKIKCQNETEINGRGPLPDEEEIGLLYEKLDKLCRGDVLVLAGSVPDGISKTIYGDIAKYLEKKEVGIVVDATGELLCNALPHHPFLVKPNKYELGQIFGVNIDDCRSAAFYAAKLVDMGARNVLVSMGPDGAVLVCKGDNDKELAAYYGNAPKGKVLYTVGAGDSMVAGFIAGYSATNDYREALRLGICAGSATAFSEGLALGKDIEALKSDVEIKQLNIF